LTLQAQLTSDSRHTHDELRHTKDALASLQQQMLSMNERFGMMIDSQRHQSSIIGEHKQMWELQQEENQRLRQFLSDEQQKNAKLTTV
jgi:C4-type Zn-finger protein